MTTDEQRGIIIRGASELERILAEKFGADGTGLHSRAIAIQDQLGVALLKKIQFVATIRNRAAHDEDLSGVPFDNWDRARKQVLAALEALDGRPAGVPRSRRLAGARGESRRATRAGARRATRFRSRPQRGGGLAVIAAVFVAMVVAAVVAIDRGREVVPHRAAPTQASVAAKPREAPWSLAHPRHATQKFTWREEQAAFIARGEKGALPSESMWKVTSEAKPVLHEGQRELEMGIQLGGGKLAGKVYFPTRDTFGHVEVSPHIFSVVLADRTNRGRAFHGLALNGDAEAFGSFEKPFDCQREDTGGCAKWIDHGVSYFALSTVSFKNALDLAYER